MEFPVVGKAYQLRYPQINDQQCVNYYLIKNADGMTPYALACTPGYTFFTSLTGNYVRGGTVIGDFAFVVSGNQLYKVDSGGAAVIIATLQTSTGPVVFANSLTQLMIIDYVAGYIIYLNDFSVNTITAPAFPTNPVYVTFQDGYFAVTDADGNIRTSTANDGLTGYTNQITPQYQGDKAIAAVSNKDLLVIVKEKTTEFYNNTGGDSIFEKVQQTSSNYGCVSRETIVSVDESLVFLARNKDADAFIVQTESYRIKKISDEGIDYVLSTLGSLEGAFAFSWVFQGHLFYQLTIPSAERTFLYDFTTQAWTELSSQKAFTYPPVYGRHTANCFLNLNGISLIGDYQTPTLYTITSGNLITENGNRIRRIRRTQATTDENQYTSIYRLELLMNTGCGLITGEQEAVDPVIIMRYSGDGGRTWSNERTALMGKIGEYQKRVVFDRLGSLRQPVIELVTTSPVDHTILAGYIKGSTGSN